MPQMMFTIFQRVGNVVVLDGLWIDIGEMYHVVKISHIAYIHK